MDIICPHCGQPTPTPADILATRATCVRCGQSFALDVLPTMVPAAAPTPAPAAKTELLVGRRLGGCRLVRLIGRGGMGEVYEAVQESLNRKVAVKVLPPGLAKDEAFIKRFNRESGALAQLSHPHIVAIHDRGCEDGHYYFVLEHVEGPGGGVAETLHHRLRNSPRLAPGDCARWLGQVGEALEYAHGKGVVHRDIKPSNVLLDQRGSARLVDFGIAHLVDGESKPEPRLTMTGELVGTVGYAAPEQRSGVECVDARADIFACGVLGYKMLTGQLPEGAFEKPSELLPSLNKAWDELIIRALQRDRGRRQQSMREFLAELSAIASASPVVEPSQTPAAVKPTASLSPSPEVDQLPPSNPGSARCPGCQVMNESNNRFCTKCGHALYEACLVCSGDNWFSNRHCWQCGIALSLLTPLRPPVDKAEAFFSRGNPVPSLEGKELYADALRELQRIIAANPGNPSLRRLKASLEQRQQECDEPGAANPHAIHRNSGHIAHPSASKGGPLREFLQALVPSSSVDAVSGFVLRHWSAIRASKPRLFACGGFAAGVLASLLATLLLPTGSSSTSASLGRLSVVLAASLAIFGIAYSAGLGVCQKLTSPRRFSLASLFKLIVLCGLAGGFVGWATTAIHLLPIEPKSLLLLVRRATAWSLAGAVFTALLCWRTPNLGLRKALAFGAIAGVACGVITHLSAGSSQWFVKLLVKGTCGLTLGLTPVVLERWTSREQLEVMRPGGTSQFLPLGTEPVFIGGGDEDHIHVRGLAPRHAKVTSRGGLVQFVESTGSRRATLAHGSWLEIGSLRLVVRRRQRS